MIPLLLSSLLTIFLLTTFGIFISRYSKIQFNVFEKILLGLVTCNTLTSYLSLFFPINLYSLLFFVALGIVLLVIVQKEIRSYISCFDKHKYIIFTSIPFILVSLFISLRFPDSYDAGLYHIQSIKWISEYPVVPGLANLHGRFGFNPNIFTFFTLTSLTDLFRYELFPVNFTILSVLVVYFIKRLHSLFEQNGFSNFFIFHIFIFLIILRLPNLSSPSPDFLSTAISLFIFVRILDISHQNFTPKFKHFIPILILGVYVLTVKLASLAILFIFIFIFIRFKSELRKLLWVSSLSLIIIAPWLIRTVILTGWLVYPFPSLDLFSFDWEVPLEYVIDEKIAVTGWARDPGENYVLAAKMDIKDWLPLWWDNMSNSYRVFFILSLAFPIIIFLAQIIKRFKVDYYTNAVIFSSFAGVLFWFILAPDWRFGEPFIIVASLAPLLVLSSSENLRISFNLIFTVFLISLFAYYTVDKAFILIAVFCPLLLFRSYLKPNIQNKFIFGAVLLIFLGSSIKRNYSKIKNNCTSSILINNHTTSLKITTPPDINFNTYRISGMDIFVPTNGDRCFDHIIPCTPYPDSLLELRGTNLSSGFKINNIHKEDI